MVNGIDPLSTACRCLHLLLFLQCSCVLRAGAAVGVAMPMTPESVMIYLGIILAGCAAVSIADSFAPSEIQSRLKIAKAALIFTQVWTYHNNQQPNCNSVRLWLCNESTCYRISVPMPGRCAGPTILSTLCLPGTSLALKVCQQGSFDPACGRQQCVPVKQQPGLHGGAGKFVA